MSIWRPGRVGLVGRIVPCGWSGDVIEIQNGDWQAKRLIPAAGQVHDRQSNLRALPEVQYSPKLEFISVVTL